MPWHPVAAALLEATDAPIAAPSATALADPALHAPSTSPRTSAIVVDLILDAGPTPMGVESTVLDLTQSPTGNPASRRREPRAIGKGSRGGATVDRRRRRSCASGAGRPRHDAQALRTSPQVELFENMEDLQARADKLRTEGKRVGVLDSATTIERLAQTVFAQLRDLDAQGVEMILCQLPAPQGLGLAVRDRLLRAAGKGGQT